MDIEESALAFSCDGEQLFGILSRPQLSHGGSMKRGILIVTGGPQYRAGSHRQFTLLARAMAAQGMPVMRFDYRGMGDSEGAMRNFEEVDADLRAAVDHFIASVPGMTEVVIWGLCDAASAALFYARHDSRVAGLVLLNPWVRTAGGFAKATLKHYYIGRLFERSLWQKVFSGRFGYRAALASLWSLIRQASTGGKLGNATPSGTAEEMQISAPRAALPERMLAGFTGFQGKVLLILCGADLTAREFSDMAAASPQWKRQLSAPRVAQRHLPEADHTFSRRVWRDQICNWTCEWMRVS